MNFKKRYRNSTLFFSISLLFLVIFLGVWLQNVYQDKVEELETEVSFLWLKSIKGLEENNFSKLIIATLSDTIDSTTSSSKQIENIKSIFQQRLGNKPLQSQTGRQQIFFKDKKSIANIEMIIERQEDRQAFSPSCDSQNAQFTLNADIDLSSQGSDSLFIDISQDQVQLLDFLSLDTNLVKSKLDKELALAQLPMQYQIHTIKDSTNKEFFVNDRFFTQTATGKKYRLELNKPPAFILKRMWFEFLMGLLLLVVITATFYYLLNNLKEQNRLVTIKNDLISNITHELRTPIFTVSAALEALESFNGLENPERTKEYLKISKNELNRLSTLVEKVLKTSLFEQDALKLNYDVFAITPLLQTISNSLQLQLEQENASLEIRCLEQIQVRADKIHLTNVVYNLIDNALKYKADRPTQIYIEVLDTKTKTQIIVSDNGIGIPTIYIDQIFNKFFRVPQGNQHNVKGYGLGLNYVSNIIKQHKGTVTIKSEEGKSSQFTISLPKHSTT
jgi:two-component system phosphate regulon sensor histidine kinase PhoR